MEQGLKRFIIVLAMLCLYGTQSVYAKSFPSIVISQSNQTLFWDITLGNGQTITCYIKDGKRFPGKTNDVEVDGASGSLWKDAFRLKIDKAVKKFGKGSIQHKKQKKKYKSFKKSCNNSSPPEVTPTPTPTPTPVPPPQIECGNGLLEGSEICDDGNTVGGDGCSATCLNEKCGDNVVQPGLGEQCDDGNLSVGDGCSDSCTVEGTVLPGGSGFSGPTAEPGAVGNPASDGYDAKVIARWDVVPYQTIFTELNIGVVAFHINGIDRVEFSANGGAWTAASSMTLNPTTGVYEYWVKLKATSFNDGVVEVRAIAYPTIGEPRLLDSLFVNSNKDGTLPSNIRYVATTGSDTTGDGSSSAPYRSIMKGVKALEIANGTGNADGGSVYLQQGSYALGTYSASLDTLTENRWVVVRPAPGLTKQNVTINASGPEGLKTKLLRLEDVTIRTELNSDSALEDYIWISNSSLNGSGRDTVQGTDGFISSSTGWTDVYFTDSTLQDNKDGIRNAALVRNVVLSNLGSDAFSGDKLVINSSVTDIDPTDTPYDPSLIEFDVSSASVDNRIYYGITALDATADAFYVVGDNAKSVNNVAFVNILFDYRASSAILSSQWTTILSDHVLFWHVTSTEEFTWATASSNLSNISIRNSAWLGFDAFGDADNTVLDTQEVTYNHFIDSGGFNFTPGTNVTTGDPGFTDDTNNDYTLAPSSSLKDRSPSVIVPIDVDNNTRSSPVSVGAYE